ncbi:ras association domain-containing protein 4 isoform X2 [Protopterus annectens]|uniref:ras association domain-containing protein 4 isoform X2 n=1 Tax=Protopterus annectens TaxID=7888 RepID=UPI001CFAAD8B|nr:ras association domain-containing protein 4 isoform X2 [Protopterus annectens]
MNNIKASFVKTFNMEDFHGTAYVKVSEGKSVLKSDLISLLKTYNCYHEGTSFQLRHREEEGELLIEGLLNISWGLRRPIRLQMQDDNERIHFSCSALRRTEQASLNNRNERTSLTVPLKNVTESNSNFIYQEDAHAAKDMNNTEEEMPQLMRTKSDASCMIQRRFKYRSPAEIQKKKRHRFSINGHFYNHKTSVFTPAYGSVTNVRVNSSMTTPQVENSCEDFALYVVHECGEKTKLKSTDYPLISRIMNGPCEKIAKLFLMEADLGEEVTYDVAQYIKFEMPVLDSFVKKLKEEEEREIIRVTAMYSVLRSVIEQRLEDLTERDDYL